MAETTTTETTRQRSERAGSLDFRRGCGAFAHCGHLGAPQPLGGGIRRAHLLPNYASPTSTPHRGRANSLAHRPRFAYALSLIPWRADG